MLKLFPALGLVLLLAACSTPPASSPLDASDDAGSPTDTPGSDADGEDATEDAAEDVDTDPIEEDLVEDPSEDPERDLIDDAEDAGDADINSDDTAEDVEPDAAPTCGAAVAEPYMELGTGVTSYVSWDDVDTALLAEGIQGGFHVWGGLRGAGFSPEEPEASFDIHNAAGERIGALVSVRDFSCDEESGEWVAFGLTVFLDFSIWPPEVVGETWELCMDTRTSDGQRFDDCVTIEVSCCDWLFGAPPEDCTNGIDDEGDRLIDCEDDECFEDEACVGAPK